MSDRFKNWLNDQLIGLVGVQRSALDPAAGVVSRSYPADLRVLLWTGVIVNIYILHEAPKTRTIKHILQQDTGQGVGAMFIVAPQLIPAPQAQLVPPEWMIALQSLNNDRLYTFSPEDRQMALLQVHLERVDATEAYSAIYGPQVVLERLHYGRIAVKPRAVKGFWLTAHFGSMPFWQEARRDFYMPPPRREEPSSASNGHQQTNGATPSARREKSRLEASYDILGIGMSATHDEVKTAFRRRVFSVHPDVSALPKMMAEEKFRILAEAYEYIKSERGWS